MPPTTRKRASKPRDARIEFRVPRELKQLIEAAAKLQGVSVSDFLAATAHQAALKTIREHTSIRLDREQSRRFVEMLLHPPAPNEKLRALMKGTADLPDAVDAEPR